MEDLKFKTAEQVMAYTYSDRETDFQCNRNKGFSMNINGYRISVQFGPGNYVSDMDIRHRMEHDATLNYKIFGTDDAEVCIFNRHGDTLFDLITYHLDEDEWQHDEKYTAQGGHCDQVFPLCSSDCVARMIGCLASCGDDDPRRAIVQIYNASFNNK